MSDKLKPIEEFPPHKELVSFLMTIKSFGLLADSLIRVADNYKLPVSFKAFISDWIAPLRAAAQTARILLTKMEEPPCPPK